MTTIIVPATGLHELQTVINELVKAHDALPPASEPQPDPAKPEISASQD